MRTVIMYSLFIIMCIASCKSNNSNNQAVKQNEEAASGAVQHETANADNAATNIQNSDETSSEINKMYLSDDELKKNLATRKHKANSSKLTNGYYPEGSERKLTQYDIQFLSVWGHKVMLNEIYARHGMIFKDDALQRHFKEQKWYKPMSYNVFSQLSKTEKQNVTFLINNEPKYN